MTQLRTRPARSALLTLAFSAVFASISAAGVRYVDVANTTGAGDGTSWADAYQGVAGLSQALTAAVSGDEIWVVQGVYKPTTSTTRSIYITLKTGVAVYGGFTGVETLLAERDPAAHVTILSGDLGSNDGSNIFTDNSFHVVNANSAAATAVLDGFTIQGGNANGGSTNQDRGGGILLVAGSNATFRSCIVRDNRCTFGGGAGYINASSPTFEDCSFVSNLGSNFGGAFDMSTSVNASFRRCVFANNSAIRAGGVEIFGSSNATLTNCLFYGNTATGTGSNGGGAILVLSSSNPTIRSCTVVGNAATTSSGAGLVVTGASASVANSIFYFNTGVGGAQNASNQVQGGTLSYCCVQGGAAGTGNIALDPVLPNTGAGDYRLGSGSPCIDAGNNALVPAGTATDLAGQARLADDPATADTGAGAAPIVDLGAFEFQPPLFEGFCFGDGSASLTSAACPCANIGAAGHGCANSVVAAGGLLVASGTAANDDVVLSGSGMPGTVTCIYLQGDANGEAVFGDGVRCAAGTLVRLRAKSNSGGASAFPDSADTVTLSQRGGVVPGSGAVRSYQTYYRNAAAAFCPPETFNVTNGWRMAW